MSQLHKDEPEGIKDALKNIGFSIGQLSHQVLQGISKRTPTVKARLRTYRLKTKAAYKAFKEDQPKKTETIIDIKKENKD